MREKGSGIEAGCNRRLENGNAGYRLLISNMWLWELLLASLLGSYLRSLHYSSVSNLSFVISLLHKCSHVYFKHHDAIIMISNIFPSILFCEKIHYCVNKTSCFLFFIKKSYGKRCY